MQCNDVTVKVCCVWRRALCVEPEPGLEHPGDVWDWGRGSDQLSPGRSGQEGDWQDHQSHETNDIMNTNE